MFTRVEDFMNEWSRESKRTTEVLATLTDASLTQPVAPQHWTLGSIAWHLPCAIHVLISGTGLSFPAPGSYNDVPTSASQIRDAYITTADAMIGAVKKEWSDASLLEKRNLYGEEWENGLTLRILIQHELHHRGQMTILMRQAGLRVPSLYGPTREDLAEHPSS